MVATVSRQGVNMPAAALLRCADAGPLMGLPALPGLLPRLLPRLLPELLP